MQTVEELHQHYLNVRRRLYAQPKKKAEVIEEKPKQDPKHPLSPAQLIIYKVALKHGLTIADIMGRRRKTPIVLARQEAMYELHKTGKYSFPQIGRFMKRDHTTILHGCRKMEKALAGKTDEGVRKVQVHPANRVQAELPKEDGSFDV